jgi:phytoene dehydrogenase-like protein
VSEAVVVGAGPNGLAGAAALAARGVKVTVIEAAETVGGGARTSELTVPGVLHDDCSAVHSMAVGSPALLEHGLERYGLEWLWPEVDLAHPLGDGSAAVMVKSIERTAEGLGDDGRRWKRLFGPSSAAFGALGEDIMRPVLHFPRHPLRLARFGLPAAAPAAALARRFRTERARSLFGGVAAHSFRPVGSVLSSSVGMALVCSCHHYGWPVARGGSQAIPDSLAAVVRENGGSIETGRRVTSLDELPAADAVLLDLSPAAVVELAGELLPPRVARAYRRYRHGPGAWKLDLAVEGGVPWAAEAARRAGTVHAVGTFAELAAAESDINKDRMPERPFVLVGQQYLADPSRSKGDVHPVWAYSHVPRGYDGDATQATLDQIERFAPGFRERIVGTSVRSTRELAEYNHNYVGGDIITGANTPRQLFFRPRFALDPYATGIPGTFICSAATPPGAGAHGMNGYNAAMSALRHLERSG